MVETSPRAVSYGQDKITVLKYNDKESRKHQVLVVEKVDGIVSIRYESGHVETLYQCCLCNENGKSLFSAPLFSSREDLNLHVQRLHGGKDALVKGAISVLNGYSRGGST